MIGSIGSSTSFSQLFSRLDTKGQGYLEQSDLAAAFSRIGTDSASSAAEAVFAAFDSDDDGKVSESEFSSTLTQLEETLNDQFNRMRLHGQGGPEGHRPPPPPDDAGFTQEELSSQLEEIGSTDSERASFISNIVSNFSAADTNSDGKVSFSEAQAYNQSSAPTSDRASSMPPQASADSERQVMQQIMRLLQAYRSDATSDTTKALNGSLSVSA